MNNNLLKIMFLLLAIAAFILLYMVSDRSKEAQIKKKKQQAEAKAKFTKNIYDPVDKFVQGKVKAEKINKKISQYRHAGLRISYTGGLFLSFIVGFVLGTAVWIFLKNPFMAVVFFGVGWNIPSMIIGFIVNKRLNILDDQIGMFMRMCTERFKVTNDFYQSMLSTVEDMRGEDPVYSELEKMVNEIESGGTIPDAMHRMASRIGNKYMKRFADYYEITAEIGTKEAREEVLEQALAQYQHHIKTSRDLKKQLSELTMEAYIMLAFVPVVVIYQATQDADYIPFMINTTLGKVGSSACVAIWLLCFWMINSKLGAPLEDD